jgi:hypothetical protein
MLKVKPDYYRLNILVKLLKKHQDEGVTTSSFLLEKLNEHIESNDDSEVTKRTLERDIKRLRDEGVKIEVHRSGRSSIYILNENSEYLSGFLNEEEERTLPFLLEIIQSQQEFQAITWLKENLHKLGMDFSDRGEKHFFMHQPAMKNYDKILRLSSQLIEHIERKEGVQFIYNPVNTHKDQSTQVIAPLQVRSYDGRFYLVGCPLDSGSPLSKIKVFAIDCIECLDVRPAVDEDELERQLNASGEADFDPILHFNHEDLVKKVGLKSHFKNCIGIVVDSENPPRDIYFKIGDWVVSYLKNSPLHKSQQIIDVSPNQIKLKKGEAVISIHVYDTVEVEFATARFRENCTRLEFNRGVFKKFIKPKKSKEKK